MVPTSTTEKEKLALPSPNNTPYLVAVLIMALIGVLGVVGVTYLRPGEDNTVLIGLVLGFLAPTTLSLLAFMKSQETHLSVNSRLDDFIRNAENAARGEGEKAGQRQAEDRADALAAQSK